MAINRREFLKSGLGLAGAVSLTAVPILNWAVGVEKSTGIRPLLAVAKGESPAENARRAIAALGGMEKFVKPGATVFLKPNSITPASSEFAINTHPDVVHEVARLCKKAGAGKIIACAHDDPSSWAGNGIGKAIESEGGVIAAANNRDGYIEVNLPQGIILRQTAVIKEFMEADVFINLPIAKHHAGATLTLGMKNYMGLNWDRQIMHRTDLQQMIADLATMRRADLIVMDATRILLNNGPVGPGTVLEKKMVFASTDTVGADAYAATLFDMEPREIEHIKYAHEMGLGEINTDKMDIQIV